MVLLMCYLAGHGAGLATLQITASLAFRAIHVSHAGRGFRPTNVIGYYRSTID
jgi:hypothetical protein